MSDRVTYGDRYFAQRKTIDPDPPVSAAQMDEVLAQRARDEAIVEADTLAGNWRPCVPPVKASPVAEMAPPKRKRLHFFDDTLADYQRGVDLYWPHRRRA